MLLEPGHQGIGGTLAVFASESVRGAFNHQQLTCHFVFLELGKDFLAVIDCHKLVFVTMNKQRR